MLRENHRDGSAEALGWETAGESPCAFPLGPGYSRQLSQENPISHWSGGPRNGIQGCQVQAPVLISTHSCLLSPDQGLEYEIPC